MKRLSVAMIVARFPNIVQTYIVSTITGIQNNTSKVTVIATGTPDNKSAELVDLIPAGTPDKILYINTRMPWLIFHYTTLPFVSVEFWRMVGAMFRSGIYRKYGFKYFLRSIVRCKAAVTDKFDIVHSHKLTLGYDYLFYKDIFPCRLVITFHGNEPKGSSTLPMKKQRLLYEQCDAFLVNTNFAKNILVDAGCPERKIRVLPQGTNLNSFPYIERTIPNDSSINILTVGRLSIEKGQHIAIRAMSVIRDRFPNTRYHLVGDGPEHNNLKELINKLELQDVVIMHGYASTRVLADIYADSHIFVLPSIDLHDGLHVETQGVVLQEAQASGLAVVASNTGGIPEVIRNNETGMLYESGNPDALADTLDAIISTPALYMRLTRKGREDVEENFDAEIITARLRQIYDSLLAGQAYFPDQDRLQQSAPPGQSDAQ